MFHSCANVVRVSVGVGVAVRPRDSCQCHFCGREKIISRGDENHRHPGGSLSRSLRATVYRAAHRPLAPVSGFDAMTIPVLSWRHPFAGTSRSHCRARLIPARATAGSALPTSSPSRRRGRQQRPVGNHQRLSARSDPRNNIPRQSRCPAKSP
jgi:hypothetical protein